jgi:hypothetical protein
LQEFDLTQDLREPPAQMGLGALKSLLGLGRRQDCCSLKVFAQSLGF